jgi:hypothetical protein
MEKHIESKYNSCLDDIYSSFMSVKQSVKGHHDSNTRQPKRIMQVAEELKLIPPREKLIRVTGSKGKGTVSRLVARYIKAIDDNAKVGLIVSPEDFDHVDRMQIDGVAISHENFIRIYTDLQPIIHHKQNELKGSEYISPSGTFFLIALKWFSEEKVSDFVIECGRGVLFDEAGQLYSKVSVVTSILFEHPSYIGPTLEDIAKDKLSIQHSSDITVIGQTATEWYEKLYGMASRSSIYKVLLASVNLIDEAFLKPTWFFLDREMAVLAVELYNNYQVDCRRLIESCTVSHSFGVGFCRAFNVDFYYEALICADSIDKVFWNQLLEKYSNKIAIIASLPDDKDLDAIHRSMSFLGCNIKYIALEGTRGYLNYTETLARYSSSLLGIVSINAPEDLVVLIQNIADSSEVSAIYALGTHTYIRLIKHALNISGAEL